MKKIVLIGITNLNGNARTRAVKNGMKVASKCVCTVILIVIAELFEGLSYIPIVGIPFSVTHAALETGRAAHTKERHDKISAGLAIGTAAAEIVLAPVLVYSLVQIPAKVAATDRNTLDRQHSLHTHGQRSCWYDG